MKVFEYYCIACLSYKIKLSLFLILKNLEINKVCVNCTHKKSIELMATHLPPVMVAVMEGVLFVVNKLLQLQLSLLFCYYWLYLVYTQLHSKPPEM